MDGRVDVRSGFGSETVIIRAVASGNLVIVTPEHGAVGQAVPRSPLTITRFGRATHTL